jgi:hypothetical protein
MKLTTHFHLQTILRISGAKPPLPRYAFNTEEQVKFNLEEAMKARRRNRDIALIFLNLGPTWGWVVNAMPLPLYSRERDTVPIVQMAGWAPGAVWKGEKNFALTGIRSSPQPILKSHSLYYSQ